VEGKGAAPACWVDMEWNFFRWGAIRWEGVVKAAMVERCPSRSRGSAGEGSFTEQATGTSWPRCRRTLSSITAEAADWDPIRSWWVLDANIGLMRFSGGGGGGASQVCDLLYGSRSN